MSSADQDAWVELMHTIREQLAKCVPLMPAMNVEEQKTFLDTINTAFWLEQNAHTWDKDLDLKLAQLFND